MNRTLRALVTCTALTFSACIASVDERDVPNAEESELVGRPTPEVAAGGTFHYRDLLIEENADGFRDQGGLLFMHNSGWGTLSAEERRTLAAMFPGPRMVELSANGDDAAAWANVYQKRFKDVGADATIVCANFLGTRTNDAQTDKYIATMKEKGIETVVPVFGPNSGQWRQGPFPSSPAFASLRYAVRQGGGIATDAPPSFYYAQPSGYQNFIIDMIKWTNGIGRKSIVIISPNNSGTNFLADTQRFVAELERRRAVPDYYVVENYLPTNSPIAATYPNRIGSEDDPNNIMGVAAWLQEHVAERAAAQ